MITISDQGLDYTWSILELDYQGPEQTVIAVRFRVQCSSGQHTSESHCFVKLPPPQQDQFITFDQLTRDQVWSWAWALLDDSARSSVMAEARDRLPKIFTTQRLPWADITDLDITDPTLIRDLDRALAWTQPDTPDPQSLVDSNLTDQDREIMSLYNQWIRNPNSETTDQIRQIDEILLWQEQNPYLYQALRRIQQQVQAEYLDRAQSQ